MTKRINIRINGRGNAWPILLGEKNSFYNALDMSDYANTSFSLMLSKDNTDNPQSIIWDMLIDAGHGTIQYYLKNCNRIPEAIIFTHPHHDHTFSLDWFVQSHSRTNSQKKFKVYASQLCWNQIIKAYPHLKDLICFEQLIYGEKKYIKECSGLEVTAYPVFHGISAMGACMLHFSYNKNSFLFTGDILTPLLRRKDISSIKNVKALYTDANNRFPYPKSNHWSLINNRSKYFDEWGEKNNYSYLISPHSHTKANILNHEYLNTFLEEQFEEAQLDFTIYDFVKRINPNKVNLLHYGGLEDNQFHNQPLLNTEELQEWVNTTMQSLNSDFRVSRIGNIDSWSIEKD